MSRRANVGSVPCFKGTYPQDGDSERVVVDCSIGTIAIGIISNEHQGFSGMFNMEPLGARALAALLLAAVDTQERIATSNADRVAAAYAAKRSR